MVYKDPLLTIISRYRNFFVSMLKESLSVNCHPLHRLDYINIRILISEIVEYLSLGINSINDNQIKVLLGEFFYQTKIDIVFINRYSMEQMILKDINDILISKDVEKNKDKLLKLFIILKNDVDNNYLLTLQGLLSSFLKKDYFSRDNEVVEKKTEKLKKLIYILISELRNKYSDKYLKYFFRIFSNEDFDKSYGEVWSALLKKESPLVFYFKIFVDSLSKSDNVIEDDNKANLLINTVLSDNIVSISDINIITNKLDLAYVKKRDDFLNTNPNIYYLKFDSFGVDMYKTVEDVKNLLEAKIDSIFYHDNSLDINIDNNIVVIGGQIEKTFIIDISKERNFNIDGTRKNIINKINCIYNKIDNNICDDSVCKIKDSLKHYKMYLKENNQELALVNLWISLEGLFSENNCFETLKKELSKLVSLYYLREYFDDMQSYISYKSKADWDSFGDNGHYFIIKNLIQKNNTYSKRIKSQLSRETNNFNNVGIFRAIVAESTLNIFKQNVIDPYKLEKYLYLSNQLKVENQKFINFDNFVEANYTKTLWQIYRIYRIRNSTVHDGKKSKKVEDATYFLEYFYILLLDDIFNKMTATEYKSVISLEEYFSRLDRTYENYKNLIKGTVEERNYKYIVLPYFVL